MGFEKVVIGVSGGVDSAVSLALACRALETFRGGSGLVELDDPSATLIRYTAGATPPGAAPVAEDGRFTGGPLALQYRGGRIIDS